MVALLFRRWNGFEFTEVDNAFIGLPPSAHKFVASLAILDNSGICLHLTAACSTPADDSSHRH